MEFLEMRIITGRDDGCYVKIIKRDDGKLDIELTSPTVRGQIVDIDTIEPERLYDWINVRHDF